MEKSNLLNRIFSSQYNYQSFIPGPYGSRISTYADYIASGQPLHLIESFIQEQILPYYANTHTEASYTGWHTSHLREEARKLIKDCLHATDEDALIFCGSGSTAAVDRMNRLLVQKSQESGQNVVIFHGPFEHHSNVLPWREGNFEVVSIAITRDGLVDLTDLETQLQKHKGKGLLIGSFSAASNVTGIVAPIAEITDILHRHGALSFWDFAAAAPYMKIDMNPGGNLNMDAVFISTHKFIGGVGTPGILLAKKSLFSNLIPVIPGGGTVQFVTRNKQRYIEDIETREEAGTPGIIESIRAGLAFKLKSEIGEELIESREKKAVEYAFKELLHNEKILILGNTKCRRLAFIAFMIKKSGRYLHHNFMVALLNDLFGIQARGGCSCAGPYGHELMDLSNEVSDEYMHELDTGNVGIKPGWCRLSLNYFIPDYEVQFLVKAIQWIADKGYLLLKDYHFDDKTALWKNVNAKAMPFHSLNDFSIESADKNQEKYNLKLNREEEQNKYFELADEIAANSDAHWHSTAFQTYLYNQVDNPLRWYTLAQDVELADSHAVSI